MEAFAVGPGNDYTAHRWQTAPNGGWSNWTTFGGPAACAPTVERQPDGRLVVFSVLPGGAGINYRVQAQSSGGWNAWASFGSGAVAGETCGAAT